MAGLRILTPEKWYPSSSGASGVEVKSGAGGEPGELGELGSLIPRTGWKGTMHGAEDLGHLGGPIGGPSRVSLPGIAGNPWVTTRAELDP